VCRSPFLQPVRGFQRGPRRRVRAVPCAYPKGRNALAVFDCGEGPSIQFFMRSDLRYSQLRRIFFLTHMHGDHVFGLPGSAASLGQGGQLAGVWNSFNRTESLAGLFSKSAYTPPPPDRLSAAHPRPCARRPSKGGVLLDDGRSSWSAAGPAYPTAFRLRLIGWTKESQRPETFQSWTRPGKLGIPPGPSMRPQGLDVPSP